MYRFRKGLTRAGKPIAHLLWAILAVLSVWGPIMPPMSRSLASAAMILITTWCLWEAFRSSSRGFRGPGTVTAATAGHRSWIMFVILVLFMAGQIPWLRGSQVLLVLHIGLFGCLSLLSTQRLAVVSPGQAVALMGLWTFVSIVLFAIGYLRTQLQISEEKNIVQIGLPAEGLLARLSTEVQVSADFEACLYFSVITQTTVGFGDIKPQDGSSRLLNGFQAMLAFVWMGWSLALFLKWIGQSDQI